jgi:transposase-like protein
LKWILKKSFLQLLSAQNKKNQTRADVLSQTKTRRSFTIQQKLSILSEYEENVPGKGYAAVSKKYGIDTKTLRDWKKNSECYKSVLHNPTQRTSKERRLEGGGRKAFYPDLDAKCIEWIKERNREGLRVTDKYIMFAAKDFAAELGMTEFKASSGWVKTFKNRNKFVSNLVMFLELN